MLPTTVSASASADVGEAACDINCAANTDDEDDDEEDEVDKLTMSNLTYTLPANKRNDDADAIGLVDSTTLIIRSELTLNAATITACIDTAFDAVFTKSVGLETDIRNTIVDEYEAGTVATDEPVDAGVVVGTIVGTGVVAGIVLVGSAVVNTDVVAGIALGTVVGGADVGNAIRTVYVAISPAADVT
jgi:hypothetical protein